MGLVFVQKHPCIEFALNDQFVKEAESQKSGYIVWPSFGIHPNHVFLHNGFLQILTPKQISPTMVFSRFLLYVLLSMLLAFRGSTFVL